MILFVLFLTERSRDVVVPENSIIFGSISYTAAPHYETPESGPMPEYDEITDTERESTIKEKESLISAKSQSDSKFYFGPEQRSQESNQEYTFVSFLTPKRYNMKDKQSIRFDASFNQVTAFDLAIC